MSEIMEVTVKEKKSFDKIVAYSLLLFLAVVFVGFVVWLLINATITTPNQIKSQQLIIITVPGEKDVLCENYEVSLSGYLVTEGCWRVNLWGNLERSSDVTVGKWSTIRREQVLK
jgi:hypothetical protein